MGRGGFGRASYDKALGGILNGEYKYLAAFIVKDKDPNVNLLGEYELFKELDEERIKAYGQDFEELNKVRLSKIEVWALGKIGDLKELTP